MTALYCVHCGKGISDADHTRCATPRSTLEPPRYCGQCARRMIVQVTPSGWTARCSRHGETTSREDSATAR
ncbi:hypothetical protein [Haloechinothrix salitolerans]|uniref:Biotin synthase auxiliary protein n=1 Tax=Haloechinothrix salitolerans TaxID=926830 RepID=A0ABW2C2Y2_9PSEU